MKIKNFQRTKKLKISCVPKTQSVFKDAKNLRFLSMNRKAIQLSVNFMVILIITLIVFGMAMYLLNMFFGTAKEIKENIDTQTENEIQRVLFSGERVAMPINRKEIKRGSSGVFGLGILNVESGPEFTIKIESGPLILQDNTKIESDQVDPKLGFLPEYKKTVKNNEHVVVSVPVRVPRGAAVGTYILDLYVCDCDTLNCCSSVADTYDGTVHKIYVNVD